MQHLGKAKVQTQIGDVDKILKRLTEIYDEMQKVDPEYVFMRRAMPLTTNKVKELLSFEKRGAVLLEYFVTRDKLFIFVVSKKGLHVEPVPLAEEKLLRYVDSYFKEVIKFRGDIGDTWLDLSQYLIEPVSEYLNKGDLIYFIPYGTLHYLPMHALNINGEPLIQGHPVCYAPSASTISFCRDKGTDKLEDCASFGTVFEEEAKEVAQLFDTKPYLRKKANKKNVMKCLGKDIIHLSCHGSFDELDPLSSGVQLHGKEVLTAREIFNMKIDSELVTLSACQTGLNERKPGDELIGLTRAFLYAGAPSVVVSLWSVNAFSTLELMLKFYELLKSGKEKVVALQEAQKEISKVYKHPYYWAPFILVGDWQ
jgi:CHAT domain-containing protein